jgi:hypothetical protein
MHRGYPALPVIRCPEDIRDYVHDTARKNGMSMAAYIRWLITQDLKREAALRKTLATS